MLSKSGESKKIPQKVTFNDNVSSKENDSPRDKSKSESNFEWRKNL